MCYYMKQIEICQYVFYNLRSAFYEILCLNSPGEFARKVIIIEDYDEADPSIFLIPAEAVSAVLFNYVQRAVCSCFKAL